MTCCVLSASPSSSAIINAVFFIAVEREKELCELALEILQEYITTITNDVLELDRMLNEGSFVSFFKQTLHLLSHSNAETDGVAKLLYKTMQTMSYKKHYGRNKTSQRDLLMQLKSNVRKQSGKTVEEVEELISKIFGDATNELYFNFKFSFTQMVEEEEEEEELKLATARKLGRRRSRSADRAPTGRTGPRTRAVSCKLRDRKVRLDSSEYHQVMKKGKERRKLRVPNQK
ncbi:hypothetical protein B566_EDAN010039, partial [Ephemera danica]